MEKEYLRQFPEQRLTLAAQVVTDATKGGTVKVAGIAAGPKDVWIRKEGRKRVLSRLNCPRAARHNVFLVNAALDERGQPNWKVIMDYIAHKHIPHEDELAVQRRVLKAYQSEYDK